MGEEAVWCDELLKFCSFVRPVFKIGQLAYCSSDKTLAKPHL